MDLSITSSLALIGLLSLACQLLGWRLRLPAILPLLIVGLLLGPGLNILSPDVIFGDVLFPLISLGVAIILFEGALTLNLKEIRGHGRMVTHLVSFGMLITWACIVVGAYYFVNFSWPLAALFGALVVVTGPTVIVPMLRSIQPKSSLGSILRWEGIVIDPIGALFAVLVYEYIVSSADPTGHVLSALGLTLAIGSGLGIIGGHLIAKMLQGHWVPHYLRNVAVLTLMLAAFSFSNDLSEESGLLTVTIMGIWLANVRGLDIEDIIEFKETLTVLLISALFILLASRLDSGAFLSIGWGGIGLLAVVMLVARPLSVWISGIGTDLSSADKWFLSWMAPRGIVAAAVSSLFAIKLQEKQLIDGADLLVPMVFLVIIGTVVIQSLTASWWARRLGVTQEKAQGVIFFGATHFARQFAKVLATHNINSVLADTNWESIRLARMDSLNVYFGNPASSHAENNLELDGIGRAMIVSPYRQTNPLVSMHYQDEFGANKVFELESSETKHERHQVSRDGNRSLFSEGITYSKLNSLMAQGSQIKSTGLTEAFDLNEFNTLYPKAILLGVITNGDFRLITQGSELEKLISTECEIISLLPPSDQAEKIETPDK